VIEKILLKNWRSFDEAWLPIDPLSVLIGTNASGKSNALDGVHFLRDSAQGRDLGAIFKGDSQSLGLRGGLQWAARSPLHEFELGAIVASEETGERYDYRITVQVDDVRALVAGESLTWIKKRSSPSLFHTDSIEAGTPSIVGVLYNEKSGVKKSFSRNQSVLSQLVHTNPRKEILDAVRTVVKDLSAVFILDPVPSLMRQFVPLADTLAPDGSNLAGLIAALPTAEKERFEETLGLYLRPLPEKDISRVYAETVGKLKTDAILYCEERWGDEDQSITVDSRGLSDGTLRFLAIITALLTRPAGSLLVVEEIDNGLHPSRAKNLMELLKRLGSERRVDLIVTTHNPSFLNACGPEMVPFIVVAHRDPATGHSRLDVLDGLSTLPKLLASGSLGDLSESGALELAFKSGARP
jgi:predicted ATPase